MSSGTFWTASWESHLRAASFTSSPGPQGTASAFLRAYAGTSCREYFADYFSYYVTNYDDTEKAAQMERLTLETFAFFSQMEAGGWQL